MSSIPDRSAKTLSSNLQGRLILPSDADYHSRRRVFNGMIDRHPAAIAMCANTSDIIQCLEAADAIGLSVSVRGGGHNIAGSAIVEGGLVIDLSDLRAVRVDTAQAIAIAQPGSRLRDFDLATQQFGLTTPTGIISDTGLAGLTLGGGLGWLMGRHGLTCDNLQRAEVVLSSGELTYAGAGPSEDADLLWALRGGGGNFGIVVSFTFRLHPLREVTAGSIEFPLDDAIDVLLHFDALATGFPDDLICSPTLITKANGARVYRLDLCHCGPHETAIVDLLPLRSFGRPPLFDNISRRPYLEWQTYLDDPKRTGRRSYWKSLNISTLDYDFLTYIVAQFAQAPSPHTMLTFDHIHGQTTRVAPHATAFGNRREGYEFLLNVNWDNSCDDEKNLRWTNEFFQHVVSNYSNGSVYVNYLGNEGRERVSQAYFGADFARLRRLKSRYDPTNRFHTNQNIEPARS